MSGNYIKLEGATEIANALRDKQHMTAVKTIVKRNGAMLQSRAQDNMDKAYIKGYSTGANKLSTTLKIAVSVLTAILVPHTAYFSFLEYGSRFMEVKPTLGPALTYQAVQFVNELNRLFK